ncbi:MAG: molybdopterin-synthase adenylyltransferase MoeB [Acidobacteria bacterium]|nr:MAG: molybdopterin-synthase adenylyltransferase MoeB [Acidobacteriota bacterium]
MAPVLTREEQLRYSRHTLLPEFGTEGQEKLRAARVLIVGLGGLGSPSAMYLAAAGVGTLGLVEFDNVDASNLQRQVIHGTPDIGRPKIASAMDRLRAINPNVTLEPHAAALDASNALELIRAYDIVVDGTDNFSTRYLVNDACVLTGTPNVYGSVFRFEGQASVFATTMGPCYRCLHPEPPPAGLIPNCAEAGVLGVLPGLIGMIQATETIKLITGIGQPLIGRFVLYDALRMKMREIALARDPECPVCGDHPTIHELTAYDLSCDPMTANSMDAMTVKELKAWRASGEKHKLIDVREPWEHAEAAIEGSTLIPMGQVLTHLDALPKDIPVVVHCKMGGRSAQVTAKLRQLGFDARNLTGGIQAWLADED